MKPIKIILIVVVIFVIIIALAGMYKFNYLSGNPGRDVDGNKINNITLNESFDKNAQIEDMYKKLNDSNQLPNNHTLCIPVKKFRCDAVSCESTEPTVFNLISGSRENPIISRCDTKGCDSYESALKDSGEYKNIQPLDPKGFIFKLSYNTIDKKFVEVVTSGLDTHISYGYCKYDFEYKN